MASSVCMWTMVCILEHRNFMNRSANWKSCIVLGSRKSKDFIFTGLHIQQHQGYSITVDQARYVKDIEPIQISTKRRQEHDAPVTEDERQKLRGLIGSLQYASTNSKPDLGSRLSFLQGQNQ